VLDRVAQALLQKETLTGPELAELLQGVARESRSSETVGTVQAI
jgi:ATP-dependent Zn protease